MYFIVAKCWFEKGKILRDDGLPKTSSLISVFTFFIFRLALSLIEMGNTDRGNFIFSLNFLFFSHCEVLLAWSLIMLEKRSMSIFFTPKWLISIHSKRLVISQITFSPLFFFSSSNFLLMKETVFHLSRWSKFSLWKTAHLVLHPTSFLIFVVIC